MIYECGISFSTLLVFYPDRKKSDMQTDGQADNETNRQIYTDRQVNLWGGGYGIGDRKQHLGWQATR